MNEHDLEEFAVLKVRKSTMPPGASLVACYDDGSGVPVLADDMYSEYVVVRRGDDNGISVEEIVRSWPTEWFKTGYAVAKKMREEEK